MAWTNAGWHEDFEDETVPPESFDDLNDRNDDWDDFENENEIENEIERHMRMVGFESNHPF